jgi:hypothetical protein
MSLYESIKRNLKESDANIDKLKLGLVNILDGVSLLDKNSDLYSRLNTYANNLKRILVKDLQLFTLKEGDNEKMVRHHLNNISNGKIAQGIKQVRDNIPEDIDTLDKKHIEDILDRISNLI